MVPFRFDGVTTDYRLSIACSVDGSVVYFDWKGSAHLLILGMQGAGKSVAAQSIVFGAVARQWRAVVIDPTTSSAGSSVSKLARRVPWSVIRVQPAL
jgi:type IV secretory pathway VirB4 component